MPKKPKRKRAKITIGRAPDGKPIVRYAQGYSKKELEINKGELKRQYVGGEKLQVDALFGAFATEWYQAFVAPMAKRTTRSTYSSILNAHLLPAFGDRQIRAIRSIDLQFFLNRIAAKQSGSQLSKAVMVLKQIFAAACEQGIIDRNPCFGIKRPTGLPKNERRALTDDETEMVLKVISARSDSLILSILYYTGMRRGEALGLRWGDIDFNEKFVRVQRDIDLATGKVDGLKTLASNRVIPLANPLVAMLKEKRGLPGMHILTAKNGGPVYQKGFVEHWNNLMIAVYEAAMDSPDKKSIEGKLLFRTQGHKPDTMGSMLTPHYFRHNFASILYNSGVDVLTAQKWLGHSDPKTTMSIYSHLSDKTKDLNADKLRKAFGV